MGVMLGDACLEQKTPNCNTRLRFYQGLLHGAYLGSLFGAFGKFVQSPPLVRERAFNELTQDCNSVKFFNTLSCSCFNQYYAAFYTVVNGKRMKRVPRALFISYFTDLSLAHLYMDNGSYNRTNMNSVICTDAFSESDVDFLVDQLYIKFGIYCYKIKGQVLSDGRQAYRILIPYSSMYRFIYVIRPYIVSDMLYKVGEARLKKVHL